MYTFTAAQLVALFTPTEIIEIVRQGIIDCELGDYQVPQRAHLEQGEMTYLMMPAFGKRFFCTKLVSVIPENAKKNLAIIQGTLLLNERETGKSLALMDAPMITALRTAAVGALGLQIISKEDTSTIGIIGCGVQGIWQSIFASAARPIKKIYCYTRSPKKNAHYKKQVLQKCPNLEIVVCTSAEEVVRQSEVIYACTSSSNPIFSKDKDLIKNKRFISIGSFRKDMQELPNSVYKEADFVMMDTSAALHEVGDIINPLQNGIIKENQLLTLGELLTSKKQISQKDNIVFKSVGMAAFDLALAAAVYKKKIL